MKLHVHLLIMLVSGLWYNSTALASTGFNTLIIDRSPAIKITHGPRIQTTAEGEEVIENASGTLIN